MASGLVRSALWAALLLSGALLVLYPVCGDNPSYTECRPHIDATIRDLAAKAIVAGETPSEALEHQDYVSADESVASPPIESGQPTAEDKQPPKEPAPEEPALPESPAIPAEPPAPAPAVVEAPPATAPVVETPPVPSPVVVEEPPAPQPPAPKPALPETPPAATTPPPVEAPVTPVAVEEAAAVPVKKVAEPSKPISSANVAQLAKTPTGIVNKVVSLIFGIPKTERDPKWAQPWQTHEEFKKKATEPTALETTKKKTSSGGVINWLIIFIFGKPPSERDEKWAQPWQSHKEHQKVAKSGDHVPKKIEQSTGGILDSFIGLLFGKPPKVRDAKWAEPWQTHAEHQKADKGTTDEVKKIVPGPVEGFINKIVKIFFKTLPEGTPRDPKWAQPWQTHAEHVKRAATAEKQEIKKVAHSASSGGFF